MNKTLKRTLCILSAALVMTAGFTSCSSKNGNGSGSGTSQTTDIAALRQELAYKVDTVKLPEGLKLDGGNVLYHDGVYYAMKSVNKYSEDYNEQKMSIVAFTPEKIIFEYPIFDNEGKSDVYCVINGMNMNPAGNLLVQVEVDQFDMTTYESTSTVTLLTIDKDGNKVAEMDMSNITSTEDENNNVYYVGMVSDASGNIFVALSNGSVRVLDPQGNKLYDVQQTNPSSNMWATCIILTNKGQPAVLTNEYGTETSKATLCVVDTEAKTFGKTYDLSASVYRCYSGAGDYLCYINSDTGLGGVKEDTTIEPVLNLLNLGINSTGMNDINIADDGSFTITTTDYSTWEPVINRIRKAEPGEIKEKQIITLGCFNVDWSIRSGISEFNKTNEDYTIYVTSYSDSNNVDDSEAAVKKFNNELLTGNIPDILVLNEMMPITSYCKKGLFTDLYTLIDNDPELSRDMFLENSLKAFENNGKLTSITPMITVETFAGKKSILGETDRLTLDEAKQKLSGMADGAVMVQDMPQDEYLKLAVYFSNFLDLEKGTCDFDNDRFKSILNEAKNYPKEIDHEKESQENPDFYNEMEMAYRNDKCLLSDVNLYSFDTYQWSVLRRFGEPVSYVNFPTTDPVCNSFIGANTQLTISENASNKDGAWTFIKYLITHTLTEEKMGYYNDSGEYITVDDDTRVNTGYSGFPILRSDLDKLAAQAIIPPYHYNSKGEKEVEDDMTMYVNGQETKIDPMTQADVDNMMKLLTSADHTVRFDIDLWKIVDEEAQAFFSGQKSVDETAAMIQSRATIYLSEQY